MHGLRKHFKGNTLSARCSDGCSVCRMVKNIVNVLKMENNNHYRTYHKIELLKADGFDKLCAPSLQSELDLHCLLTPICANI